MLGFKKKATELELLIELMTEAVEAEPWHGKSVKAILNEVAPAHAFQKPGNQHSILELVWHMATWKEFCVSRLKKDEKNLADFEESDWRPLDHHKQTLWQEGLDYYWKMHRQLMELVKKQDTKILDTIVPGRKYNYRKLLNGICQHDVYHGGQIIYIQKLLQDA
jgi:uncharacterized damage-inducible protein DinB